MINVLVNRTLLLLLAIMLSPIARAELTVLTYHDILSDASKDQYAVSRSMFVAHMDYLETHGYRVLSLKKLNELYRLAEPIPKKSVMLTFDDGLKSYYEFVVPVLKIYGYPSIASVVTSWVDGVNVPREYQHKIMSWKQIREIAKSGLVDIISHSHNLHTGILSNPQGNEAAAAVTRKYFTDTREYESEKFFRQRIHLDFKRSIDRFKKELRQQTIAIAWPYGQYDDVISREASLLGLKLQFSLDAGPTTEADLPRVKRIMLVNSRTLADFTNELAYNFRKPEQINVLRLKLDDFVGLNAEQQEALLSKLLDAVEAARIGAVLVNPFYAKNNSAFFPNNQIKVSADILNRITHQLKYRLSVNNIIIDLPRIKSKKLDEPKLYKELSRLNWFNGVLVGFNSMDKVNSTLGDIGRFHPGLKFGVRNTEVPVKGMNFATFTEKLTDSEKKLHDIALRINNMSVETYLLVTLEPSKTEATATMLSRMRQLGVKRLGISSGVKSFIKYNQELLAIKAISANTKTGVRSNLL